MMEIDIFVKINLSFYVLKKAINRKTVKEAKLKRIN
jgi:hypothetical protein